MRQMGDRLSDAWEKKWHASGIEGKWEDIVREQKADEVRAVSPLACAAVQSRRAGSSQHQAMVVTGAHVLRVD